LPLELGDGVADTYFSLSPSDQSDALAFAADSSGRPAELLEKDIWVVWVLDALFNASFGGHLSFKGGTSLSKAYRVIRRFSEDVDITYDIRALLPAATKDRFDALPATRSQQNKWSNVVRTRLPSWIADSVLPVLESQLATTGAQAEILAEGESVQVRYSAVTVARVEYVKPLVLLEFGARSTGEPFGVIPVDCEAAAHVEQVIFPTAKPRVLKAERTFWEKATCAHAYCLDGTLRGERYARHWYDLVRLDETGYAALALADLDLALSVARHKSIFFSAKDVDGNIIDYVQAVSGGLRLVPEGQRLRSLTDDYASMVEAGLLEDDAPSFEQIMEHCQFLQDRSNTSNAALSAGSGAGPGDAPINSPVA
jgi:nucleotidyltransferase AbiEii toxin of type IV toxin-antitoxin system